MKNFYMAYCTDVGIKKDTNQDSLLIKGTKIGEEDVTFAVLCDGNRKSEVNQIRQ